jgi:hypothetical protein
MQGRRPMEKQEQLQQTCKSCHCIDKFNFHVPDYLWERVVPENLQNCVVCLECFDGFAADKELPYTHVLDTVYFAGEKAQMELKVVDSHDP